MCIHIYLSLSCEQHDPCGFRWGWQVQALQVVGLKKGEQLLDGQQEDDKKPIYKQTLVMGRQSNHGSQAHMGRNAVCNGWRLTIEWHVWWRKGIKGCGTRIGF